ncbi:hypothetical protein HPT25_21765 [Bacillus sp. BRMEA1]|uniref:hypothetical protein n=1 Tax=Neobacillus endophyticus TaxID=2738405 RepID=UPI001566235D|nr:hypothetical protein [Neobacillus endophyticus]NRD79966.1 hypothetical protein [Neobacillus endophyticus]
MKKTLSIGLVMVMLVLFALVAFSANEKDKNGYQPWEVAMKGCQYFVKGNKKALWGLFTSNEKKRISVDPSINRSGKDKDYRIEEYKNTKKPDIRYYAITHTIKWGRFTDYIMVLKVNDVWKIDQFNMDVRDFRLATKGMKAQKINPTIVK